MRSADKQDIEIWFSGAVLARSVLVLIMTGVMAAVSAQESESFSTAASRANQPMGHYESIIFVQTKQIEEERLKGNSCAEVDVLLRRAEAYMALGSLIKGEDDLERALKLTQGLGDPRQRAAIIGALGSVRLQQGKFNDAKTDLEESLRIAQKHDLTEIEAATLINLGNLQAPRDPDGTNLDAHEDLTDARRAYEKAVTRAEKVGRADLAAQGWLGAGRMAVIQEAFLSAQEYGARAKDHIESMMHKRQKAFYLVSFAKLLREIDNATGSKKNTTRIEEALLQAELLATQTNDLRTRSLALAYLGDLSEHLGNITDAVRKTRQALFLAQAVNATDLEFRWQAQLGRVLVTRGKTRDIERALEAYDAAIGSFEKVQLNLASLGQSLDPRQFRRMIDPIFEEYVDLLLKSTTSTADAERQEQLETLRKAFERVKGVELQNYFQDQCVARFHAKDKNLALALPEGVAGLYSIVLPNHLVLLFRLPDGQIEPFVVNADRNELIYRARVFWKHLQDEQKTRDRTKGKYFYDLLIKPIPQELLTGIDTIVFVPDSVLGLIPLVALYDGQRGQYLGERFAVATVPGLNLVDLQPISQQRLRVLAAGLTHEIEGYAGLRYVQEELEALSTNFPTTVLKDEEFSLKALNATLRKRPHTVIHMASHARFGKNSADTYLLTGEGETLHMDDLERLIELGRFRENGVELLTLSACETATGDEREALGLAGVALKSGADSALASLWKVDDEATYELITKFYNNLKSQKMSKAKALQKAQQALRKAGKTDPRYWAAFVVIGNWL